MRRSIGSFAGIPNQSPRSILPSRQLSEQIIYRCLENRRRIASRVRRSSARSCGHRSRRLDRRPPPKAGDNLPNPVDAPIGRRREIATIRMLWNETRLVTLSRPAGIGKTRLALEAAADLIHDYPDGVYLLSLDRSPTRR